MQDALYNDLTPAQRRLVDQLGEATGPIVATGERTYTLDGERIHYATVGALERRGLLERRGDRLVLVDQGELFAPDEDATAPDEDAVEADEGERARALPVATSKAPADILLRDDDDAPAEVVRTARSHAALRADEDRGKQDPAVTARAALRRTHGPDQREDASLFARLWRRLDGLLSS